MNLKPELNLCRPDDRNTSLRFGLRLQHRAETALAIFGLGITLSGYAQTAPPRDQGPEQTKPPASAVQVVTARSQDYSAELAKRKTTYQATVKSRDWVDTGVLVTPGDRVHIATTGSLQLADNRTASPEGAARGWRDLLRQFPFPSANVGALIGRVGASEAALPFAIGADQELTPVTSGHLFLAANLASDLSVSTGEFRVKITLAKPTASSAAAATQTPASPSASRLTSAPEAAQSGESQTAAIDLENVLTSGLFDNIPRRVEDLQHNAGDMVNFGFLGTREQLVTDFKNAGWVQVDKTTQDAVLHGLQATLAHEAYVSMPMSVLYLFGRPQDFSYARAAPLQVAAIRHHLRVWSAGTTVAGRELWVGSATHDNGFETDQRTGGITHHIDPNIDEERDFLLSTFQQSGSIAGAAYVLPKNPVSDAKTATGGSFQTDGRIIVMQLR